MRIRFKDVISFRKLVLKSGYTLTDLARLCKKNKTGIVHATRVNSIGPDFAKRICDVLQKKFDDLFIIVEK